MDKVSRDENSGLPNLNMNRYNTYMTQKKISYNKIFNCICVAVLLIVTGCATTSKEEKIRELQKKRIHSLEAQLKRKQQVIAKLKAKQWAQSNRPSQAHLWSVENLTKQKKWVIALQKSTKLTKIYPKSIALRKLRYQIFKSMGLKEQALIEQKSILSLRAAQKDGKTRTQ